MTNLAHGAVFLTSFALLLAFTAAQPSRRGGPPVRGQPNRRQTRGRPAALATVFAPGNVPPPPEVDNAPVQTCVAPFPQFRSLDGTCTSELDVEWGATEKPQFSYPLFTRSARVPTGGNPSSLPSARLISNIVCTQAGDIFSRRRLNEMVTFMGQFLDHSIIATPVLKGARFDIPIPKTDPIFSNFTGGRLHFERSVRALDARRRERPINELSSAIDLTAVYGPDGARLLALRTLKDGLMKVSRGNLLPLNFGGLSNAPSNSAAFFVAGDRRANENPMLTALHTLFLREHNRVARQLKRRFPFYSDEQLFQNAKTVTTATYQKIIFDEFFPIMTGRRLGRYTGYKFGTNPTISDVFGAAAFRIGHTMVNNQISRRGPGNRKQPDIKFTEMFFRKNGVLSNGIEPFIRGAIFERSQEVDTKVVNALRNFLFTNVPNEIGLDLMALNIQRGRDHTIPTYNELREMFGTRRARTYRQITRNRAVQTALSSAYGSIDKIDGIIGLFAEDHARGASMGPTMLRIWRAEFRRLRDGDRFFYLRESAYPRDLWERFPPLRRMINQRNTFKKLILRNTNIRRSDLRGSVWKAKARW